MSKPEWLRSLMGYKNPSEHIPNPIFEESLPPLRDTKEDSVDSEKEDKQKERIERLSREFDENPQYTKAWVDEQHQLDIRGYTMSATRVADFLVLRISRDQFCRHEIDHTEKADICINLSKVEKILVESGKDSRPLDVQLFVSEGDVEYKHIYPIVFYMRHITGRDNAILGNRIGLPASPLDVSWFSSPKEKGIPKSIIIPPEDDLIHFVGSDTIRVPFGTKDEYFQIIMDAIRDGYEPPVIPLDK